MRTSVDVRKYGEAMREQGKTSFDEARKLVHAWVGVTDAAYQRVRTELKDLDTRAQASKLQRQARRLSAAEVRDRIRDAYSDLAKRGEKVIRELRRPGPAKSGKPEAQTGSAKPAAQTGGGKPKAQADGGKPAADKATSSR